MLIAKTPEPPYYAVIFTNLQTDDIEGYAEMAESMEALAQQQPGYLGIESARADVGITISYWKDLDSISAWKQHAEHLQAQSMGKSRWYSQYSVRIALVEKQYSNA